MKAHYGNPALEEFRARTQVVIQGDDCREDQSLIGQLFQPKATKPCTRARSFLSSHGVPFTVQHQPGELQFVIGDTRLTGYDEAALRQALVERGMPLKADPAQINTRGVVGSLFALVLLATMVYGPMGAFLVEQFPTQVRYSGVSSALQFGNGWIGGFAPFVATAMVVASGDMYRGLIYTVVVSLVTVVIGAIFVRDRRGLDMREVSEPVEPTAAVMPRPAAER